MIKSVLITVISFLHFSQSFGQYDLSYARQLRAFKTGLGGGYAIPPGNSGRGGLVMYAEPAYRLTDQVGTGFRFEGAFLRKILETGNFVDRSQNVSSVVSCTLNGQYYFGMETIRPFVGAGVGLFRMAAEKFNTAANGPDADYIRAETRFGFYPRLGIEAGHLNFMVDYNVVPPTDVPGGGKVRNSYLGIRAGVCIGGGRKTAQNKPVPRPSKKRS